ncbi:DUF5916 domain-containing protein [Daejeonella oryzae]|uniref:DUF5916 domain-containing protein n=1 Tax=Daejeonella oryzae TaxID=1122943 RepID=UPI00042A8971|nr:DUF5916 domain-containing protein [Daejeonella oryzae]
MKQLYVLFIFLLFNFQSQAQPISKKVNAVRLVIQPRIDGILENEVWENIEPAKDFRQYSPRNDAEPSQNSEIKIGYDHSAIYIAAFLYDTHPDSILKQLTQRDDSGNADQFLVSFDTFSDQQNAFIFGVTAAGVQIDDRIGSNIAANSASNFDVVWESAVKITDKGWFVEMKIPFSALRFPKKDIQLWGVNFRRDIRRLREEDLWSQTPATAQNIVPYFGSLQGISHVNPPLRLFLTPYLGTTVSHYPINKSGLNNYSSSYSAGADLKYGINESFTLDMTLVPDFGQIASDPKVLNLSPYEVQFDENREFFKEGIDLFNQGALFYPRRIGKTPAGFNRIQSLAASGVDVTDNPAQVRLLNAAKISGRTPSGLGLGILNAITARTEAHIKTSSGADSVIVTEPFANYNILALNQTFDNNSSVSFINTNVTRDDISRNNANVTGLGFVLGNRANTYALRGFAALSQKIFETNVQDGFKYTLQYGKINGNFQFNLLQTVESDQFNPNDLGILKAPDEFSNSAKFIYRTVKPRGVFLRTNSDINFLYSSTYKTRQYQDAGVSISSNAVFKNFLFAQLKVNAHANGNDFFEARIPGRVFKRLGYMGFNGLISTDYRKRFAIDISTGIYDNFAIRRPYKFIKIEPRYRFSDKFSMIFTHHYEQDRQQGFADIEGSDIVFAERFVKTDITELESAYSFSPNMSLSVQGRYYWSRVKNYEYKLLTDEGYLAPNTIGYNRQNDQNANFFNADLVYRWRFAPGSDFFVVYKNNIQEFQNQVQKDYFRNVRSVFNSDQQNTLNLKVLYFLDYLYLKNRVKS